MVGISSGLRHTLVLTEQALVYSFGSNEFGQLGIYSDSPSAVSGQINFDQLIISPSSYSQIDTASKQTPLNQHSYPHQLLKSNQSVQQTLLQNQN